MEVTWENGSWHSGSRCFADTEEVTGSNPVAPTTVLTGQGPVSAWPTALLTCRGRAAAAVCSLAEPDGLSGLTTQDHHQPNDHGAWSLPPGPAPWSGITPTTCPNAPAGGLVSTRSFSCSPANRPAPWRWTSSLVGQAARRRRSLCACDTAAQIRHRPSCEPPTANAAPSLPSDPCGQATTPPADHGDTSNPLPQRGRPAHRAIPRASAVRTARLQSRGHRRPVRPDTPAWHRTRGHRTRGHRTSA